MSNLAERKQGEAMFAWRERLRWAVLSLLALVVLAGAAPTGAAEEEKGTVSMTSDANMAANILPCSVDTVPIQIIDGGMWAGKGLGPVTTLSTANIPSYPPGFKAFVTAVTEHLATKLAQEKLCLNSAESQERSLIQFAYMPLVTSKDRHQVSTQSLEVAPSSSVSQISSPWLDIAIEREPVLSVQAIVRFNERQFLADQAVLAGAHDVPPGLSIPFRSDEFTQYLYAYERYTFDRERTGKPLEELVPLDLLWLFRRVPNTERAGPFGKSVYSSRIQVVDKGSGGYTKLVVALIDQCFASDGANIHYDNILDVGDLVSLEQYKSTMPIIKRYNR